MAEFRTYYVSTPLGTMELRVSATGLRSLRLTHRKPVPIPPSHLAMTAHLRNTLMMIRDYFDGKSVKFQRVKVDFSDLTGFEVNVLNELRRVPYGQVVSYAELARRSGYPGAARAVGNALNKNPIPILVPCHRVICSNQSLGGYGLGVAMKKKLLQIERVNIAFR